MKIEGLLPIGSVVKAKEVEHHVMITGYAQVLRENGPVFDYCGCLWPEGFISADRNLVFNHEDIEFVYSLGYQTDGQMVYISRVEALIRQHR